MQNRTLDTDQPRGYKPPIRLSDFILAVFTTQAIVKGGIIVARVFGTKKRKPTIFEGLEAHDPGAWVFRSSKPGR